MSPKPVSDAIAIIPTIAKPPADSWWANVPREQWAEKVEAQQDRFRIVARPQMKGGVR